MIDNTLSFKLIFLFWLLYSTQQIVPEICLQSAVDPGFPIGGHRPIGGTDLRLGRFWRKHAKMKELGSPGSATDNLSLLSGILLSLAILLCQMHHKA